MSDQPKPTGEWTAERIGDLINTSGGTLMDSYARVAKEINAALNAAIAAETQKLTQAIINVTRENHELSAAAEKVCELYFNIASEVIGEAEVRRRRDDALAKAKEGK